MTYQSSAPIAGKERRHFYFSLGVGFWIEIYVLEALCEYSR